MSFSRPTLGNRPLISLLRAPFQRQHYAALVNMAIRYPKFSENLWRYLTSKGDYPYDIQVRTPVGAVSMRLYSHHDLLTVNEIFCRQDYFADAAVQYVVDLGSNIGISALYFLTRNASSKCILYEPDPRNVEKLQRNLSGFEDRYTLTQSAVSDQAGRVEFGIEPTGRYGGIAVKTENSIVVECLHINDVLRNALREMPQVDVLKIDTEGVEVQTVEAIDDALLCNISTIYMEARPRADLHPSRFRNKQYGSVRQLFRIRDPRVR